MRKKLCKERVNSNKNVEKPINFPIYERKIVSPLNKRMKTAKWKKKKSPVKEG